MTDLVVVHESAIQRWHMVEGEPAMGKGGEKQGRARG